MYQTIGIILCFSTVSLYAQSILFPHGYFDPNKITAYEAFYLNMLAVTTLENNGITIQDLDDLTASRIRPEVVQAGSLKEKVHEVELEKEKVNIEESMTPLVLVKERPLTKDNRPPAPFKSRVRREDDDEESNPFEDIATRAPSTLAPNQLQRVLNREMILGISDKRPRHRIGIPHEGEMSEQGWMHPRRRRPFIDIDLAKSQIVELPLPPDH